jgi:pyridoxal phosphate enzyme (YggS family)
VNSIAENVRRLRAELPPGVRLMAAAKGRRPAEVLEAIEAGITLVGENYVQEAAGALAVVGRRAEWHFIGHLQTNKARAAIELFDMIETVDSLRLGREIDKRSSEAGKVMPVLIEVNSGCEPQKFGALPEEVTHLARELAGLDHLRLEGLMTMGRLAADPEESRPDFRVTKRLFDELHSLAIPGVRLTTLSMGMTESYRVAIEEGANLVRLGTRIFGARP